MQRFAQHAAGLGKRAGVEGAGMRAGAECLGDGKAATVTYIADQHRQVSLRVLAAQGQQPAYLPAGGLQLCAELADQRIALTVSGMQYGREREVIHVALHCRCAGRGLSVPRAVQKLKVVLVNRVRPGIG